MNVDELRKDPAVKKLFDLINLTKSSNRVIPWPTHIILM
jgi:hypothetical protein